jgi:hypothetical protein
MSTAEKKQTTKPMHCPYYSKTRIQSAPGPAGGVSWNSLALLPGVAAWHWGFKLQASSAHLAGLKAASYSRLQRLAHANQASYAKSMHGSLANRACPLAGHWQLAAHCQPLPLAGCWLIETGQLAASWLCRPV